MEKKRLREPKKGDPITAAWATDVVDRINRNTISVGGGLNMQRTANGTVLSAIESKFSLVGKTSSGISARAGTTAGSGTVTPQAFDGTDLSDDPGVENVDVFSYAGTAIGSGKYCLIELVDGYWWIVSVEC